MQRQSSGKNTTNQAIKKTVRSKQEARPFLKWAGGKSQLLDAISARIPDDVMQAGQFTYVEPFVGSGAVLFWVLNNYPGVTKAVINDINEDLINAYKAIQMDVETLISCLQRLGDDYYSIKKEDERKVFFLERREEFNTRTNDISKHSALLIFLNRTCFNGLYRVNSKNEFNVPFGKYKNPRICDTSNLKAVSKALQKVTILNTDFTETYKHVDERPAFFYLDPPYKPISQTSSFNSYSKDGFDDKEQKRLKKFLDKLNGEQHPWLLSNSDPKNIDPEDDFFDTLYKDYIIERVKAKRAINSNAKKRGEIAELLIRNYERSSLNRTQVK